MLGQDSRLLIQYIGQASFEKMLRRTNPHDVEQWAYAVLLRLQTQAAKNKTKRQRRERALEEISLLRRQHTVMGQEEEERLQEWEYSVSGL